MAFSTTALRHGWVYLTALGIVTGTTIYVMNNTRRQIKPEDIIEIVLGTTERCLATQITTNPTYRVDPPLFVQSWVKTNAPALGRKISGGYKAYVINYTNYWPSTTGVGAVYSYTSSWAKAYPVTEATINYAESWTATGGWVWVTKYWSDWSWIFVTDAYETVTNTIGWYPDRDMMISLDSTIKALVPYYVDTNTVYDGTTNIIMLTVTGLWASLGIGERQTSSRGRRAGQIRLAQTGLSTIRPTGRARMERQRTSTTPVTTDRWLTMPKAGRQQAVMCG